MKTTTSLYQSNVLKKKTSETSNSAFYAIVTPILEANDDIDDLLDLIDDAKGDNKSTIKKSIPEPAKLIKTPPKQTTLVSQASQGSSNNKQGASTVNNFAVELSDDDLDIPAYDPTARDTSNKRPSTANPELAKKKEALFGLSNSAMTNMNKTQSSDFQNSNFQDKPQQRPQTMETKQSKDEDDFGEINIGFSRRKNQNSGAKKKPEETKTQETKPLSLSPGRPPLGNKIDIEHKDFAEEDEEEESKYLSSFLNKDKNQKSSLIGGSKLSGDNAHKSSMGRIGTVSNTAEITTPVKSPRSEFTMSKEGFFQSKDLYLPPAMGSDKKEDTSIPRNPIGILGKKDLSEPQGQLQLQQQLTLGKSVTNLGNSAVRKERVDGFGNRIENLQGSGVSNISGDAVSMHAGFPGGIKDAGLQVYLKETEEYYKKRSKESEEYYENRYKQLKKAVEEEKTKWEEIHEKELKLVKKENEDLKENMNKYLERERERIKEMFALEMESKEKIHSYELQRQRHQFEEENLSLKKQLEAQAKLNSLADEIKTSSNKLISLSDKMENGKSGASFGMKGDFREKEKQLEDMEKRLRHELEMVNDERKRLDRIRLEIETRDREERESMEKERGSVRQEYTRLNELQDSIRKQELDKMRNLEKEKTLYQLEREKLEKESQRTKEEYSRKYHELEVQVELHNVKKNEFDKILDKTEIDFLKKQEEIEATMKRLTGIETDLMRRVKELEHKEALVRKSSDEVQRRLDLLELDRITFEKERNQVLKIADQTREDNEKITRFRLDFEDEQQKNMLLRSELAGFATSLKNERNQLAEERNNFANMSKALETLKHDYVKEIGLGQRKALVETNRPPLHNRERSFDAALDKAPFTYVTPAGATWGSGQKNPQGRENRHNDGFGVSGAVYPPNDRLVRLKDLKDSMNAENSIWRELRTGTEINKVAEENSKAFKKMMHNSDGFQNWAKSTSNSEMKNQPSEKFDYNNYMAQLKQIDRTSNINQSYIEMEREELLMKKISSNSMYSPKKPYSLASRSRSEKLSSPM